MRYYRYLLSLIVGMLAIGNAALIIPYDTEAQSSEPPNITVVAMPEIPTIAFTAHANGKVLVELNINSEGTVIFAHVIDGHPLLRKATQDAVLRWQFAPMAKGKDIRTLRLTFVYTPLAFGATESSIIVLPYNIDLNKKLPENIKPSDTVSFIPSGMKAGRDRCKVHGEILKKDKVEIVYGLVGFREGYLGAQEKQFPNANTAAYGGCIVEDAKYAEVLYCWRCRRVEARWIRIHRKNKFTI